MISKMLSKPVRAAAFAAMAATMYAGPAMAAASMAKYQAPGFYRTMLGDFEVTVLNDGTVELAVEKLLKAAPAKVGKALAQSFLKTPLETSVNAYLVNTGEKLVLIDAGAASLFGPTLGKLMANLKASGYQPEQVDEIYITHMHPDHVGGLALDGQQAFPNAIVRAGKADADYWLNPAHMEQAPAAMKDFYKGAIGALGPYQAANKFQPIVGNIELVPGVKAYGSAGHTPGHTSYVIESKGRKLVLLGDLLHVQSVQFDEPNVTIGFDTDSKSAAAERKEAFLDAAKHGYLIGASHLQFPALGHVRAYGKAYQFVPVNYTIPR